MTQIEKIKAEIERLKEICKTNIIYTKESSFAFTMEMTGYDKILSFINSLPKEPVSEDLEKELNNQMDSIYPLPEEDDFDDPCYSISNAIKSQRIGFKKGFEVGANWQKEQMLKDAVDGLVGIEYGHKIIQHPSYIGYAILSLPEGRLDECEAGDKVKLIIVKED